MGKQHYITYKKRKGRRKKEKKKITYFFQENYESSVITLSHLSSKIFTASVNNTSGGNAPVDSMETRNFAGKRESKLHISMSKTLVRTVCVC